MADLVDVVVVGMGPGGEEVAGRLADAGLDVVGVDERLLGGECPYYGCIPSKIMVRAADLVAEAHRVPGMAGTAMVTPDFGPVARHVREATAGWDDSAAVERFRARGGVFVRGRAVFAGPDEVAVLDGDTTERCFRARKALVIATGSTPAVPPLPGLAGTPYWTNREAVAAERAPSSLLVLGGGAVGLELAQAFARFDSQVTVLEAAPRLMSAEEPEAHELLLRRLAADGLDVRVATKAVRVGHDRGFTVVTDRGERLCGERLLVATGRRVDLDRLGISALDLPVAGPLPIDERLRVRPPTNALAGVWAVGDVTGRGMFTHVAMYQADVVVRSVLGEGGPPADHRAVPRVTFTDPEIGAVGLTEAAARARGLRVAVGTADVAASARGYVHRVGNEGFVKLVADTGAGVLVGGTFAGPCGGEALSALSVAVRAAVPLSMLGEMIWAYPTFHRAIGTALADLRR